MNKSPERSSFFSRFKRRAEQPAGEDEFQIETITPALSADMERLDEANDPDRARKLLASFVLISREVNLYPPKGAEDKAVELVDQFEHLTRAHTRMIVMTDKKGDVVSAANVVESADMQEDIIDTFATNPEYRGQGHGSRLLEVIEQAALMENKKRLKLESMYDAEAWYTKRGFKKSAENTSFSHNPTYEKPLDK